MRVQEKAQFLGPLRILLVGPRVRTSDPRSLSAIARLPVKPERLIRLPYAREQRVPLAMTLCVLGSTARKRLCRHPQLTNVRDVELLPAVRCATPTIAAELKHEQALDAMSNSVVMRLGEPGSSGLVDEFDKALVGDGAQQIGLQRWTEPSHGTPTRDAISGIPDRPTGRVGHWKDLSVGVRRF